MQHEGMVHALQEIQRVLAPGGILIDLRPVSDRWPIEIVSNRARYEAGHGIDLAEEVAHDEASNQAVAAGESKGWFVREQDEFFRFHYYWDTPSAMQEFVDEEWQDFIQVDEETWKKIRSLWASADADARIRVAVKMLITRWRKG